MLVFEQNLNILIGFLMVTGITCLYLIYKLKE